jgi:hypothetical protein
MTVCLFRWLTKGRHLHTRGNVSGFCLLLQDHKRHQNKTKDMNLVCLLLNINIKYNNSSIECVQKYTYLGVVFNTSGSFTTSKQEIHNKDNKA